MRATSNMRNIVRLVQTREQCDRPLVANRARLQSCAPAWRARARVTRHNSRRTLTKTAPRSHRACSKIRRCLGIAQAKPYDRSHRKRTLTWRAPSRKWGATRGEFATPEACELGDLDRPRLAELKVCDPLHGVADEGSSGTCTRAPAGGDRHCRRWRARARPGRGTCRCVGGFVEF